ncbi:MAG: hypothetical protein IT426_10780 [Pirellulales bacterium]|nr:hypothetical protein [Pirellulales bacterium]
MTRGADFSAHQLQEAVQYNRNHRRPRDPIIRGALGLAPNPSAVNEEEFARFVADWQEDHIGAGEGDGKLGPKTEAYLGIQHPKATAAAVSAEDVQRTGNILFDSWGNDVRDNDNDGVTDGAREQTSDGAHYGRIYNQFSVVAGSYPGLGWGRNRTLIVSASRTLRGSFRYCVCADVVSQAYAAARVMQHARSTAAILQAIRGKGYVWRRSEEYPREYLPGDFICTLGHGGGHSGIVVRRSPTNTIPTVVELPGPSTMVDLGTYNPANTNDVRLGSWTKAGLPDLSLHYLGRLLLSKCPA